LTWFDLLGNPLGLCRDRADQTEDRSVVIGALNPIDRAEGIQVAAAPGPHTIVMLVKLNPLRKILAMFNAERCGPRSFDCSAERTLLT